MKSLNKGNNDDFLLSTINKQTNVPSVNYDGNGVIYVNDNGDLSGVDIEGITIQNSGYLLYAKGVESGFHVVTDSHLVDDLSSNINLLAKGELLVPNNKIVMYLEQGHGEGVFSASIMPRYEDSVIGFKINGQEFTFDTSNMNIYQCVASKVIKDENRIEIEYMEGMDNVVLLSMSWLQKNKPYTLTMNYNYIGRGFPYKFVLPLGLRAERISSYTIENEQLVSLDTVIETDIKAGYGYILYCDNIGTYQLTFVGDAVCTPNNENRDSAIYAPIFFRYVKPNSNNQTGYYSIQGNKIVRLGFNTNSKGYNYIFDVRHSKL